MADDPAVLAQKAAKSAHRAMILTMVAVGVAILVLAIDNSIKRSIIEEAQKIRGLVGRFEEATSEITADLTRGAVDLPANGVADPGGGGMADDAAARAKADGDAVAGKSARAGRSGGRKPGP